MKYGYIRKNKFVSYDRLKALDIIHENDVLIENIFIESSDSKKGFRKVQARLHKNDILVVSNIYDLSDTFEEQLGMIQEIVRKQASVYLCDCDVFLSAENNIIKLLELISCSSDLSNKNE